MIPAKLNNGKDRKLLTFKTEQEALDEAQKQMDQKKTVSLGVPSFLPDKRIEIEALIQKAGGMDVLHRLVRESLIQKKEVVTKKVQGAFDDFIIEKEFERVGNIQVKALKSRLARFLKDYGDRDVDSFNPSEMSLWLQNITGISDLTKRHIYQATRQFFGFCERREWLLRNVMESVASPKAEEPAKEILTPEQFHKMLGAFEGEERLLVALGGYAGLRTSEITGNEDHGGIIWSDIDLERGEIHLNRKITKKKRERCIPICAPLLAILKSQMPKSTEKTQNNELRAVKSVVNINFQRMKSVRASLAKEAGLKEWLDNALRHSFASYHLAKHEDAAKTSLLIGHKDAATTHRHYARLVRKEDAVKWFGV